MQNYKTIVRNLTRGRGVEVRQFDPDLSLDTFLWTLFAALDINCVIDVGGHRGEYATLLRNNGYRGEIISFEPVLESYQHLMKLSAQDSNWQVHRMGLGNVETTLDINVGEHTNFSSFHEPSSYGHATNPHIATTAVQTVPVKRLDAIFDKIMAHIPTPRIYLKMDTQGWDANVFEGTEGCRDRILALQSEMSIQPLYDGMPTWMQTIEQYQAGGYEISSMFAGFRDDALRLSEFDCVMVRQDAV